MPQFNLQTKFLGITIGIILVTSFSIIFFVQTNLKNHLTVEIQKRSNVIAFDIATECTKPLLTKNTFALRTIVNDYVERYDELDYLFITDPDGDVLVHTFDGAFPAAFRKLGLLKKYKDSTIKSFQSEKGLFFDITMPVLNGGAGVVHVGVIAEPIKQTVSKAVTVLITIISVIALVGCILAIIFVRIITNPVLKLTHIAEQVGRGDLSQKADDIPGDEIGKLAISFNQMIDRLKVATEGLEQKVEERTEDLVGINTILENEITERKQAEEENAKLETKLRQAHKMEAIGTLAGGIAHDFNNLLNAILGYSQLLLLDTPKASEQYNMVLEIEQAGRRATELVKQILTFSRRTDQERQPIQLQFIVKEVLKLLRSSLPTTIEIRQDINTHCSSVLADSTQIHQVTMNLCTNAFHAMHNEKGTLIVRLEEVEVDQDLSSQLEDLSKGKYVKLTVSDTGHGITMITMERIFEPYFTTKKQGEGTGLGLATVHGIVKSYGGAISVDSELGKGTTFSLFFPVAGSGVDTTPQKEEEKELPELNARILFVDDVEFNVQLGTHVCERLGGQVKGFTNSLEALAVFRKDPEKFDIVITDQTMPNLTGVELAQEMFKIRPDLPVIMVTGHSGTVDEQKAKEFGIQYFLMKPLGLEILAETINKALENKRS